VCVTATKPASPAYIFSGRRHAHHAHLSRISTLTKHFNGPFAQPRDWDALQRAYESHIGDLGGLAAANKIKPETLASYAHRRGWTRHPGAELSQSPAPEPPADLRSGPKTVKPKRAKSTAAAKSKISALSRDGLAPLARRRSRSALLPRLYATIDRKLQQLEAAMATNDERTSADHEREARVIGSLIRGVEKVNELNQSDAGRTVAKSESADGRLDPDVLCRELAARIQRLRERRAD
jgi:hypothetical protein